MSGAVVGLDGVVRCAWCGSDAAYVAYHDEEWGRPERDERGLFEQLSLEAFQSGLSWSTILGKRAGLRRAFAEFDPQAVAAFGDDDVSRLVVDAAIVRHRGKIEATIANARAVEALHTRGSSLSELVWRFAGPARSRTAVRGELPAQTAASQALSDELRRAGFRFVGPTTVYAFMQAAGIVDDHVAGCFRAS